MAGDEVFYQTLMRGLTTTLSLVRRGAASL